MNTQSREVQLAAALTAMWAFASGLVAKHGEDGDATMTDEEHATWKNIGGTANVLLAPGATSAATEASTSPAHGTPGTDPHGTPETDPYAESKAAGYTVHKPDMDCATWHFCVGDECVDGFTSEIEAWDATVPHSRCTDRSN